MKPEMFCRNTSGIPRWSHSSMKCAPFWADSLNSTPLLAMMPTGCPWMCANPVTSVVPYSRLNSWNSLASTMRPITSCTSYGAWTSVGTTPYSSAGSSSGSRLSRTSQAGAAGRRHRGDDVAHDRERVPVVLGEVVGDTRDGRVRARPRPAPPRSRPRRSRPSPAAGRRGRSCPGRARSRSRRSWRARRPRPRCTNRARRRPAGCGLADIRAWLKKMRPKWSRSGNTSSCIGRNAPPESTSAMHGSRFSNATS